MDFLGKNIIDNILFKVINNYQANQNVSKTNGISLNTHNLTCISYILIENIFKCYIFVHERIWEIFKKVNQICIRYFIIL